MKILASKFRRVAEAFGFAILFVPVMVALSVSSASRPDATPAETPKTDPLPAKAIVGIASYYGKEYHGKRTANGEVFDMNKLTAAHRSLPFGTRVRVTNLLNDHSVIVRVNDRGPFVEGRVIDLSEEAAQRLGMLASGLAQIRLETVNSEDNTTMVME